MRYDLCLASNWEHDEGFIRLLDAACATRGLTLLTLAPRDLPLSLPLLATGEAGFSALLDRASEADPAFLPLVDIARSTGARRLNPRELADRAYDKAAMHRAFNEASIATPRTIILPSFRDQPDLPPLDLAPLGGCFAVKPALGGGGEGVVMEVSTLEQVQSARQEFPEQQYLLQAHVTPARLDGLPAWFRVIYCLGEIYPCFWDTTTHVYTRVENARLSPRLADEQKGGHAGPPQQVGVVLRDYPERDYPSATPREVTRRIAQVCRLDLFSTEIARTADGQFLVVDYVNDPIDLRLKSRAKDGVPDEIVEDIAARIAEEIKRLPR